MHTQNRKESAMDITGVGNLSYLYNYGIPDSDTRHVTGKENGIGSVDENGKQKECQTCKNRKYVDGSNEANVSSTPRPRPHATAYTCHSSSGPPRRTAPSILRWCRHSTPTARRMCSRAYRYSRRCSPSQASVRRALLT